MKVILFRAMALTYPHSCAMKNHVDIIRVIAIGILAAGDGGEGARDNTAYRPMSIGENGGNIKLLMAFDGIRVYRFSHAAPCINRS